MKYINDWNKTDEETSIFLQKNEKYYDISITTVKNILYEVRNSSYSPAIASYPSKTIELLEREDPNRQCRVYENYNSGWGCIYKNVYCIELI